MKDFLHCLYAAHLTDHHVLVVKMTTKHLGSITSWALYLYTNLKHKSEQYQFPIKITFYLKLKPKIADQKEY